MLVLLCVVLALTSCAGRGSGAYSDVLRSDFSAQVQGVLNGVEFSAQLEARTGDSGREVIATFYAPEGICGTVAAKRADGSAYWQAGDVILEGGDGMAPLFDLFTQVHAVSEASLDESGHTVVQADGLTLTLLPDGTPYRITTPTVDLTVISWEPR